MRTVANALAMAVALVASDASAQVQGVVPPCRHLRMVRLFQVRRALSSAHGQVVTVTAIATSFGFAELGRFSVEYRKVFGESPSVTLRRASRSIGVGTAVFAATDSTAARSSGLSAHARG